jgi:hypothetical protein
MAAAADGVDFPLPDEPRKYDDNVVLCCVSRVPVLALGLTGGVLKSAVVGYFTLPLLLFVELPCDAMPYGSDAPLIRGALVRDDGRSGDPGELSIFALAVEPPARGGVLRASLLIRELALPPALVKPVRDDVCGVLGAKDPAPPAPALSRLCDVPGRLVDALLPPLPSRVLGEGDPTIGSDGCTLFRMISPSRHMRCCISFKYCCCGPITEPGRTIRNQPMVSSAVTR